MNQSALFKKLVDFLLIFLLVFLALQLFNGTKEPVVDPNGKVVFTTDDNKYSIPASVDLKVDNKSPESVSFNNCNDIVLSSAGDIIALPSVECRDIVLESGASETLNYAADFASFSTAGAYKFAISLPGKQVPIEANFEITNKGAIAKIFTAFIYAPMYNGMVFLLELFSGSLGWAIISITIIIRFVLMYPQHKMMVSQKKLQAVQPKIKALQEKYKGQQAVL